MKRIYLIVWVVLCFQSAYSQELTNFYLESGSTNDEVVLHTSFYYVSLANYYESSYTVDDNVINFSICYQLDSSGSTNYDDREFTLSLPSGYPNFILNVNLFIYDDIAGECDYDNSMDSGIFTFDYPYTATATTFVPDDTFEAYFEFFNLGDDIPENDYVFTHKIINLNNLDLDYSHISTFGPRIADLTGIEILYRLKDLKSRDNAITQFDGANHPQLEYLRIANDQLESVDLSLNADLWYLEIGSENLIDLDISTNTNLRTLYIEKGPNITELDLSTHLNLFRLGVDGTGISSLNLTNNLNLISFGCYFNVSLTSLILGEAPGLSSVVCNHNALELLDVSTLISLVNLSAIDNNLTQIDLSLNVNLKDLSLYNNSLTHIDLSHNPNMESMFIMNNNLSSLDLRNGFSQNITLIFGIENPALYCIDVDDPVAAPYGNNWLFGHTVAYSEDCSLGTNDTEQVQAVIYPNPVRDILTIETKENIASIEVYSMLGELLASEKGESQIDFSTYVKGIYFLKIDTEKSSVFQKVLKE